jgi:hypothetical protein
MFSPVVKKNQVILKDISYQPVLNVKRCISRFLDNDLFVKNGRFRLDINARVVDQYVQVLVPLFDHVPGQLRRVRKNDKKLRLLHQ